MDRAQFRDWFSRIDELTAAQCRKVAAVLSDPPESEASLAAIELGVGEERRCPHCGSGGAVSRGKSRGLRRYRCKSCGRTFGALTGTALSGLHRKERWLSFAASLAEGETIRGAAVRCGIAPSTAFRWRHRFLAAVRQSPDRLAGIVEADETFVLESRKGERNLNRTLPKLDADSVKRALAPVIAPDALLVSDAGRCHRPAAAALGILHESVNRSPASGCAGPCTSRRSTAATARSRASCAASAASPPSISTAI